MQTSFSIAIARCHKWLSPPDFSFASPRSRRLSPTCLDPIPYPWHNWCNRFHNNAGSLQTRVNLVALTNQKGSKAGRLADHSLSFDRFNARAPGSRRISRCRMPLSFSPRSGHRVQRIEVEVDALSIRQSSLDLPSQIIGEHLIAAGFDCTHRLSNYVYRFDLRKGESARHIRID